MKLIIYTGLVFLLGVGNINEDQENLNKRLWYQYEEEKLAFDFYTTMYEKWNLIVFQNIAKCEEKHMKQIMGLINDFGDPELVVKKPKGQFVNKEIDIFYKEISGKGNKSLEDALYAAALMEERDVDDLEKLLAMPGSENIQDCVNNLFEITKVHLNTMICHLKHRNLEYRPVYLSTAKYINCVDPSLTDLDYSGDKCRFTKENCPYLNNE